MQLSVIPLLLVSASVPREARHALWMAQRAAHEPERTLAKETAARALLGQGELSCEEVRELVDLPPAPDCKGLWLPPTPGAAAPEAELLALAFAAGAHKGCRERATLLRRLASALRGRGCGG